MSQLTAGSSESRPTHTITHPKKDKLLNGNAGILQPVKVRGTKLLTGY
jgi:hypothetical protein